MSRRRRAAEARRRAEEEARRFHDAANDNGPSRAFSLFSYLNPSSSYSYSPKVAQDYLRGSSLLTMYTGASTYLIATQNSQVHDSFANHPSLAEKENLPQSRLEAVVEEASQKKDAALASHKHYGESSQPSFTSYVDTPNKKSQSNDNLKPEQHIDYEENKAA